MAATHALMGDTARALDWLDRAFDERSPALIYLRQDATFTGMSSHPRVARIVREMKFPGLHPASAAAASLEMTGDES